MRKIILNVDNLEGITESV